MIEPVIYPVGDTAVTGFVTQALQWHGMSVLHSPSPDVTHVLLPIPQETFTADLATQLPSSVTVIGGNLNLPGYRCIDLLKDEGYLSENAMITAHIAINIAASHSSLILSHCPILILGWGRIGKCLMKLAQGLGADVTVAARKKSDLGIIQALGCRSADIRGISHQLHRYRIIFNTVPFPVLDSEQCGHCRSDCIKIDLASKPGIASEDVIFARGLPGKYAPESSGRLIAKTIRRLIFQKEAME